MEKSKLSIILLAAVFVTFLAGFAFAAPPKVTKTIPENGDQNVDPGLRKIHIEFDQDMTQGGYSICGGGPKYPKTIGKPKWLNKRTIVMRVKLKPNHRYELSVNCQSYRSFRNTQGQSAVIHPIKFKTAASGSKSTKSSKSPRLLLQEAISAEETEGDLDKAIELYEQVVEEASGIQRLAAKATYQLGMCYLKKGDKTKAAEYFQQVTSNYPTQKVLAKKANKQLVKIAPDITPEDRPYIVWFKSTDSNKITTAKELLDTFNANHLKNTMTFRFKAEEKDDYLIGRICVGNGAGKEKILAMLKESADLELIKALRAYTVIFKPVDSKSANRETLMGMFNANHPQDVSTYYYKTTYKDGSIVGYISTDTEAEKDKLLHMINASSELKLTGTIVPEKLQPKESVFEQIDYQVIRFISEQFGKTAFEAGEQHLMVNSHVYYVDRDGFRYQGGMNAFYNWTGRTITQKTSFGGTSYPNQTHYGVDGNKLNTEIVPDKTRPNHWQIYWIPDEPLAPEESLYYGWSRNNKRKTSKLPGDVYSLTMDNKYGSPVIETFFLVLPKDLKISQSNPPTSSQELLNFNVYWWTKTVQQGEGHTEQVQLKIADVNMIVEKSVLAISTCAEGDPRIHAAMANIESFDESAVLSELKKYLTSEKGTIRRSAIYVIWQGEFSNIADAITELEKLCSHDEDLTRGMAGLALGQNKVLSSFDILKKMTLDDPSGYARRCGAYALGLLGDTRAKPILEKALNDPDRLVQNNAEAALTMLTKLKD